MGCAPVNRPQSARRQAPLRRREIAGVADGVIPVYRRSHGTASCSSGGSVAEVGVYGVVCYIGVSNSIPVLLPPLQDSASYRSGQNAGRRVGQHWTVAATRVDKMPVGFAYVMVSSLKAGIRAGRPLSLHPLGPRAAWAQQLLVAQVLRPLHPHVDPAALPDNLDLALPDHPVESRGIPPAPQPPQLSSPSGRAHPSVFPSLSADTSAVVFVVQNVLGLARYFSGGSHSCP